MKLRAAVLVVAVLSASAAPAALAAKRPAPKPLKKVCNVVTDPAGDASLVAVPGDGTDDILSADLGSDGKTLTAVVRLADLAVPDPESPLGHQYMVQFGAKGSDDTFFLAARIYPYGAKYVYGYTGSLAVSSTSLPLGDATGSYDTAKHEVHITVPNAAFASRGTKLPMGTKLTPDVTSWRILGQGLVSSQFVGGQYVPLGGLSERLDDATGGTYAVGQPSCVTPGK